MVIQEMNPCFFKPLIGDFAQKLLIPPAFVKKLKGKLSWNHVLKYVCEKTYTLKIVESEDALYFINGWQEYVKDHRLELGDFIIFRLIDNAVFEVSVYDPTMCEKFCCQHANNGDTPNQPIKIETSCSSGGDCGRMKNQEKEIEIESDKEDSDGDDEPKDCSPSLETDDASSFKLVLNETHKTDLPLPTSFVSKALLAGNSEIVLRDPMAKKWPSKISEQTKRIVHLTGGWIGLYIANKFKKGDTCTFKYRSEGSSSNNLQVIQIQVKRGRGRPPKIN